MHARDELVYVARMPVHRVRSSRFVDVALSAVNLSLAGRVVLRNLHWRIRPGERWVLMGANGAGKTQLLKLLAGDVWPTPRAGSARLYTWRGAVLDEPYGVKQEISYLGAERQDRYEHYEWNHRVLTVVGTGLQRHEQLLEPLTASDKAGLQALLRRLGIDDLARRRFLTLSYGQRRLVLLARALAWRPGLLLLDEPTNGLDPQNRARVLQSIHGLRKLRLPWVYATHRVEEIPPSATHVAVLARGALAWQGTVGQARRQRVFAETPVARKQTAPARTKTKHSANAGAGVGAAPWFVLKNAWVWRDGRAVLRRLTFDVLPGQCWVVHGANGSGKSTLLRALYGDLGVASQGELRRRGIEPGVAIGEFKQRVGFVAPELQTSHPLYLTAEQVVISGLHSSIGLDGTPTRLRERRKARGALREFAAAKLAERTLRQLSYGQLRRVLFARAAVHNPDILLLDEPYTGLDAATRALLQDWVARWVASGRTLARTVVMVTHHRDEWPAGVTHELQLQEGRAHYCGVARKTGR
jgi:molybdate transport system ATP-binding protein